MPVACRQQPHGAGTAKDSDRLSLAVALVMPSMPATQIARNQGAMLHATDLQHHRGRIAR